MNNKFVSLLVIAILFALVVMGVSAQDVATATSDPDVTVTPPEVITVEPTNDPISWTSMLIILSGVLGALLGGGSFALVFTRLDKRTKDEIERSYRALSPDWQATIQRSIEMAETINKTLADALKVAHEVTDGKPNELSQEHG